MSDSHQLPRTGAGCHRPLERGAGLLPLLTSPYKGEVGDEGRKWGLAPAKKGDRPLAGTVPAGACPYFQSSPHERKALTLQHENALSPIPLTDDQ